VKLGLLRKRLNLEACKWYEGHNLVSVGTLRRAKGYLYLLLQLLLHFLQYHQYCHYIPSFLFGLRLPRLTQGT
jgi:hypothetical protein